jgi:hypothetical protein
MAQNESYVPLKIQIDPENFDPETNFDWDEFIAKEYARDEQMNSNKHRRLMNYDHAEWNNYYALLGVRTEYYYRYSGTQTIPPCYGKWFAGNQRRQTNHWRVMKDPVRISQRQLDEMHRLLRERIAPAHDPVRACQPDTAAKVSSDGTVDVARPLQSTHTAHFKVFCECPNWRSKWIEDRQWCEMRDKMLRFYSHPYNFQTIGF